MGECSPIKRKTDQALKHISHNDEEIWGESVPLPKAIPAFNPVVGDTIEENRGEARVKDKVDPAVPDLIESSSA